MGVANLPFLSHNDIEHHHQHKPYGKADGAEVAVLAFRSLRYEFFYDDIDHRTGGEGKEVWQGRCYERGRQHNSQRAQGLHSTDEPTDVAADEERIDEWDILKSDTSGGFYVPLEDFE